MPGISSAGTAANSGHSLKVVITGASSGLGEALAVEIARRHPGATLLLIARRGERLQALCDRLGPTVYCHCAALDVTDGSALQQTLGRFVERHGAPDLVIANAGVSAGTSTGRADDRDRFRSIVETNLFALRDTFDAVLAPMRAARRGTLVGIASIAGFRGLPGSEAYSASKAAALASLESLRVDLHGSGLSVVTIAPGFVKSEMPAVNDFPMPFLMEAAAFARAALDVIERRRRFAIIPWPMAFIARLLRILPIPVYDAWAVRAPRKPRPPGTPDA